MYYRLISKCIICICLLGVFSCSKKVTPLSKSSVNIIKFGCKPNDGLEDTQALQKAIRYSFKNKIDTIFVPKGEYILNSVNIHPGQIFLGEEGSQFIKVPNAGKWSRMFTTQKTQHLGDEDSDRIEFHNLNFDGNKDKQGAYKKYELQQQHLIFIDGNKKQKGRVRALVKNCHFKNSVADAISIYCNADVKVQDCSAYNVFRGGVVLTGGHSKLSVINFKAGGEDDVTGVDIEIDGKGFRDSYKTEVYFKDIFLEGDFDVNMPKDGVFTGDNIQVTGPGFFLLAKDNGKVNIKNSSFVFENMKKTRLYFPGSVVFQNCNFTTYRSDEFITGLRIYMETSYRREGNQSLKFIDCNFYTDKKGEKACYALLNIENFTHVETNIIDIDKCVFDGDYDSAIFFSKGGNAKITNSYFKESTPIEISSSKGKKILKLKMDKVRIDNTVNKLIYSKNPWNGNNIEVDNLIFNGEDLQDFDVGKFVKLGNVIYTHKINKEDLDAKLKFDKRGLLINDKK